MIKKIRKEQFVWKIIRNASNFFLVEAVLPIGTNVYSEKGSLKIRVNKAKIL